MAGEAVAVVEQAAPTPQENDDNFAAAFMQLTEEDKPAATTAEKPAVAAVEPAPTEPKVEEGLPKTEAEKAAEAAAEAAKTPPVAKEPDPASEDMLARLAKLVKEAPAEEAPPQQVRQPGDTLTEEETTLVGAYVKDYPDIARAESIIRKTEYQAVAGYIFAEVAKELQPMMAMLQTIAGRTHLGDLQAAVPDYNASREQVIAWVDKQPDYLKTAYQNVVKQGTVAQVADLIRRYKQENPPPEPNADGTAPTVAQASQAQPAAPAAKPAAVVAAKPAVELSAAAKKAVAALAPVQQKRTGAVQTEPTTYDDAFAVAAKELEKL